MHASSSFGLYNELKKIIDIPDNCTKITIKMRVGEIAILETTQDLIINEKILQIDKKYKLLEIKKHKLLEIKKHKPPENKVYQEAMIFLEKERKKCCDLIKKIGSFKHETLKI